MSWRISIPMAIPSGNTFKRAMYGRNRKYYSNIRRDFGSFVKVGGRDIPKANGPRSVTITRIYPRHGKLYDVDNLHWGCKPLVDELVAWGILVGDAPHQVHVEYKQERGESIETVVEVREWRPSPH